MRPEWIADLKAAMVPIGIAAIVEGIVLATLPVYWDLWYNHPIGYPGTPGLSSLIGIGGCLAILGATAILAVT